MLGHKNTERHFSSGGNLEEIGHESNLSANVASPDPFNLPLPDHVHDLIPSDGSPRRVEAEEAESGIDSPFDEPMVLFDEVVEVFTLSQLSVVGEESFFLRIAAMNLMMTSWV
jgi:hypothetical protein